MPALTVLVLCFLIGQTEAQQFLHKGQVAPYNAMIYDSITYAKLKQFKSDCDQIAKGYDTCYTLSNEAADHVAKADSLVVAVKQAEKARRQWWAIAADRRFWYGVGAGALAVLLLLP